MTTGATIRSEDGFTLIELLVTVAVLAILAAVAVFAYRRHIHKSYTSEVYAMIAAMKQAEEAYKAETGQYVSTGSSENDFYPRLATSGEPKKKLFQPSTAGWRALNVSPPAKYLYCGYVAIAGPAGSLANAGPAGKALFGNQVPQTAWYYIRATCDLDGNPAVNSIFETTFDRERIHKLNEGR